MAERVVTYRLSSWESPLRTEPSRIDGRYHRAGELEPTQWARGVEVRASGRGVDGASGLGARNAGAEAGGERQPAMQAGVQGAAALVEQAVVGDASGKAVAEGVGDVREKPRLV